MNTNDVQKVLEFSINKNGQHLSVSEIANLLKEKSKKDILNLKDFLINKNLLTDGLYNSYKLTPFAYEIIDKHGSWIKYIEYLDKKTLKESEKEKLELEKSKVDLELAKETLKEFPRTKWFARIGFIIAVILALKELYTLLKPILR